MQWRIKGTDHAGREVSFVLDAATQAEAETFAIIKGIQVSSVSEEKPLPFVMDDATPGKSTRGGVRILLYEPMLRSSASWLSTLAKVCSVIGGILLTVGGFCILASLFMMGDIDFPMVLSIGLSGVTSGFSLLIIAAVLKWFAGMGLATLDIATLLNRKDKSKRKRKIGKR